MRIRAAAFVVVVSLVAASCGSSITNPTTNTNTVLTGVMPAATTGVLNVQVAGFFPVGANGFTSVTFNSLTPALPLFYPIELDIFVATGNTCSSSFVTTTTFLTTGNGVQGNSTGIVMNNLTLTQGSYCVLLTDVQGQFKVPETFTVTVSHP